MREGMFVPAQVRMILREGYREQDVEVSVAWPEKGCCTPTIVASYQTAIAAPRGCLFETGTRCNFEPAEVTLLDTFRCCSWNEYNFVIKYVSSKFYTPRTIHQYAYKRFLERQEKFFS